MHYIIHQYYAFSSSCPNDIRQYYVDCDYLLSGRSPAPTIVSRFAGGGSLRIFMKQPYVYQIQGDYDSRTLAFSI